MLPTHLGLLGVPVAREHHQVALVGLQAVHVLLCNSSSSSSSRANTSSDMRHIMGTRRDVPLVPCTAHHELDGCSSTPPFGSNPVTPAAANTRHSCIWRPQRS
jgi:hypothetical protein